MARGRAVAALVALAGIAGVVLWRRRSRARERVDVYYADGSMVSFQRGSLEAGRLVPIAEGMLGALNGDAVR